MEYDIQPGCGIDQQNLHLNQPTFQVMCPEMQQMEASSRYMRSSEEREHFLDNETGSIAAEI